MTPEAIALMAWCIEQAAKTADADLSSISRSRPQTPAVCFIACPYCHRHGGFLKPQGSIGDKRFAAKLYFRPTGSARTDGEDEDV